ncbi:MAG TPA: GntR family transcriptional regulator [Candidatus Binatia bacterium]|nr:GntR family transcriptional regulator [Candidatus Binatia bacterium]
MTDQAKAYIKQRIINDEFEDGRIPSETDLANELGVSRTTIRDALSRLENEGAVYRRQGSGTYVNNPGLQIKTRLEEIWSYESVLLAHGYTPSTRILSMKRLPADEQQAANLNIRPGEELIVVEKLFLEDQKPVILAINRVPQRLIVEAFVAADWRVPVYEFLWQFGQQRLSYYLSEIVPVTADVEVARALAIAKDRPLISFVEIGYNDENSPILLASSFIRDDLLRLRLIRRKV